MKLDDMFNLFDKFDNEHLKFDRVVNKLSNKADLHAFILLSNLVPKSDNIVSGADHDIIYLNVGLDELAAVATEDHILELIRCGIFCNIDCDCLSRFV